MLLKRHAGGPQVQISVDKCLTISSADLVLRGKAHANLANIRLQLRLHDSLL